VVTAEMSERGPAVDRSAGVEHGAGHGDVVERHLPLVRALARRYAGRGEELDDLVQVGSVGLVKAANRFDPERQVPFTSYAIPLILGEIRRHFRDHAWAVAVPRRLKEQHLAVTRLLDDLAAELGRSPSVSELAAAAELDEEEVIEAIEAGRAYSTALQPAASDDSPSPVEALGTIDGNYEATEDRSALAAGWGVLDERERRILELRFFDDRTQTQIAYELGISQMHVSRLIRRALEKLRDEIEPTP
jgi:RNA polymerase sigma-B factor